MNKSSIEISKPASCDALVTFTLLRNSEDFIQGRKLSMNNLSDLSALVDSVMLHPRIITIKGVIPNESYPQQIIDFLTKNSLISFYHPSYDTRELVTMINQYSLFRNLAWCHFSLDSKQFQSRRQQVLESRELMDYAFSKEPWPLESTRILEASTPRVFEESEIKTLIINDIRSKNKDLPQDYNLFDVIHVMGTGGHLDFRQYLFRTVVYLCSADYDKLTFYPDYVRIPYVSSCVKRLYSNLSSKAYDRIAAAFNTKAREILNDVPGIHLTLPPFLYMILEKMVKGANFFDALLYVRSKFESMRRKLGEIDGIIRHATTIKEKGKGLKRKQELLMRIAKKYGPRQHSLLKELLSFTKDLVCVLHAPKDPRSYNENLLLQPYEWLRDWWLTRPVTHLLHAVKRLERLPEIFDLLYKAFGYKISSNEVRSYEHAKNTVASLMRRYEESEK